MERFGLQIATFAGMLPVRFTQLGNTRMWDKRQSSDETSTAHPASRTTRHTGPTMSAYSKLRALARSRLIRFGRDEVLDTTALVHDSYLRFANNRAEHSRPWTEFVALAPNIMRNVAIDSIRSRNALSRGGGSRKVILEDAIAAPNEHSGERVLQIREAVSELRSIDARLAAVVEMRFFEGLTETEVADELGVTERTVRRDWEKAKLVLADILRT
jgi:RNA polymerase sigma factor (TIGR02999 family)